MDNRKMKISQEELELLEEGNCIIEKFNNDPELRDIQAPNEIYDRLQRQIREFEEFKSCIMVSKEDEELIRLRKLYKKYRRRNMYLILAATLVLAFGVCMTSMGGADKVFEELKRTITGREQSYVNTDSDQTKKVENIKEEEAYEQIEEEFGFSPIRLDCLPEGMKFCETDLNLSAQCVQLVYEGGSGEVIKYRIQPHYRTNSIGYDVEDVKVKEYNKEVNGVVISVKGYFIEENKTLRWNIKFEHKDIQYALMISGLQETEVQKIIDNLYFY